MLISISFFGKYFLKYNTKFTPFTNFLGMYKKITSNNESYFHMSESHFFLVRYKINVKVT